MTHPFLSLRAKASGLSLGVSDLGTLDGSPTERLPRLQAQICTAAGPLGTHYLPEQAAV